MTVRVDRYEQCVKDIVETVGKNIVIGVPLGLGKPIGLLNALYRLACADSSINLTIFTGLTLARPHLTNELEKRLVEPILDRLLKDHEDPLYERARALQQLPANINVIEFFLTPGKYLHNAYVQQHYISSCYTTVVRDLANLSVNVLAQMVAPSATNSNQYSLSCNSDLFHGLREKMLESATRGAKIAIVAEVNANLPFMYGKAAVVDNNTFTNIVDPKQYRSLFVVPRDRLSHQDHLIGLYMSPLIKDDGCLQIGIGKLSNALANALIMRHKNNNDYRQLMRQLNIQEKYGDLIASSGSLEAFNVGLYASTEMLSDEYMELYKENILKKKVYDDHSSDGKIIHAGFFLGSGELYSFLHDLPEAERQLIEMTTIARTNSLLSNPELLKRQRQHARFVNSSLMVTLLGGIISDGLSNYQELSGVGGQFDFVSMATQMEDARSIINCHSTRVSKGKVESNILWDYTNFTISRYLRDIVVTEYGVADCRSKTDADVIKAMLNVADSRFQPALLDKAKKAGKISADYQIPSLYQNNYPEAIEKIIEPFVQQGYCQPYPFGSDLTEDEEKIAAALLYLSKLSRLKLLSVMAASLFCFRNDATIERCLKRMGLGEVSDIKEYMYMKLLKKVL